MPSVTPDRRRRLRRSCGGFTLIELIIVVLLITLSVGLLVGRNYSQRDSLQLQTTARKLYSFFLAARSAAILDADVNRCLYRRDSGQIYTVLRRRQLNLPPAVSIVIAADTDAETEERAEVELLTYYADGSSSGGDITLVCGQRELVVHVDPLLGFVHMPSQVSPRSGESAQ